MKVNGLKVVLIAATLVLSACSGTTTTRSCFSDACKLGGNYTKLNTGGGASALGNSYNEYGSSLLHD
ncbi:hypothetical protein C1Y35_19585 [Pseudomonas sp. GW456-L14]|uniref:hypothetical protein n=1 Tax=unclassified Pseudomonas TaxID=196821 RepID=UPI000C87FF51|nr:MULTISPECIES: hypothetical protein [unclassified Pseudomonas]PMY37294.1 hypothetical protein C1Y35_19585 [Pseudomonas sp. GW456-L14]PMY59389.1 hypothetical protein C1Y34_02385 [Pseudomonas sp. GW456-L12]